MLHAWLVNFCFYFVYWWHVFEKGNSNTNTNTNQPVIEFGHILIELRIWQRKNPTERKRISLCAKTIGILKGIYVTILSPDDVSLQSNPNHFSFVSSHFLQGLVCLFSVCVCVWPLNYLSVLWVCFCVLNRNWSRFLSAESDKREGER